MSGERVLVIDDSQQIVRHLAEQVLPTFGFQTMSAMDGQSGLERIRRQKPDLIMLDLNLPDMTGLDILRTLVQESIAIPVVLMTGYGSEKSAIEAFRLGAKDYIIKPFSVDEVLETINRALLETRLRNDKQKLAEQLRRAHAEMRRRINEMSTLFGIGKAVSSLLSASKILDRVLEAASYLTNAEESTIWLQEQGSERLKAYAKRGSENFEPQIQELSLQDSQVGQVLKTGRALRESAFSGKGIQVKTGYTARAILYVPLMLRGRPQGVLSVSNRNAPRSFSERDESLLSALADYAAIALENARVFQQTDRALAAGMDELQSLIQITRVITSSLDLNEVVQLTIKQVHASWQIEASSLWFLEQDEQVLRLLANVGTPAEVLRNFKIPVGQGFVGHVVQTQEPIYTNDVTNHPLHYRAVDQKTGFRTRSLLCVPLIFRNEVIGALQLLNKLERGFDEHDLERAVSIATAVAIGVTNALLFSQSESREQQLAATLEHNGNPIIITDNQNRFLLLNRQSRTRLGLTRAAIGLPVETVLALPELVDFLTQPLEGEGSQRAEIVLPDESVWLSTLAPIPNYGRILILQDITYLKELDRTKSHFVSTVSHDLRAPLNAINDFAAAVEKAGSLNEIQQQNIANITSSVGNMMLLVNGLLDLARVSSRLDQVHQSCDLVDITRRALHDLEERALSMGVELTLTVADEIGQVQGDADLIGRAIGNLVDNAIKVSADSQTVQVELLNHQNAALIKVKDTGKGIAPVDLPHIFDKFYQVENNSESAGLGLGLTMVQSIAEAHGGNVWVESEVGLGSTFVLRLPLVTAAAAEAPPDLPAK